MFPVRPQRRYQQEAAAVFPAGSREYKGWNLFPFQPGMDAVNMTFNLSSLNEQQHEAVITTDGPVLVLAGAGSGKTRVITARIAHLIRSLRVPPESVLAVTFTNKAAREMRGRVSRLLKSGKQSPQPLLCTFHAFGVRFLRAHIAELGYRPDFVIFDSQDQQSVVKSLMEEGDYDLGTLSVKEVNFSLQHAKGRGVTPEELLTHSQAPLDLQLGRLLREYNRTMKR
ncbi:MAG: UvrD-helicase domain-containing protein, partial [bacterium]